MFVANCVYTNVYITILIEELMVVKTKPTVNLGNYFIVTSGYCETGGLVSRTREALLFLEDGNNHFRLASMDEKEAYMALHPILK